MGLVLTMLNIKQKEIAKLEEYANLREEGLRYSETLLNQDIKNFIDYFRTNRENSSDAMKQAEMYFKTRSGKNNELMGLEEKYQTLISMMTKDIEKL